MTVKQWIFWTLPWILAVLDLGGIAQGQTAAQLASTTAGRRPTDSRRPGDDRVSGAALRDGDPDAGAD